MHRTPVADTDDESGPGSRRRRPAPATTRVAAVPDEKRIRRQAPCGIDDHRVGDEGERERPEIAGTEGARDEQSEREVAEARDALVGTHPSPGVSPPGSAHVYRMLAGTVGASGEIVVTSCAPEAERPDRPADLSRAAGALDRVLHREAVDLQQPGQCRHPG